MIAASHATDLAALVRDGEALLLRLDRTQADLGRSGLYHGSVASTDVALARRIAGEMVARLKQMRGDGDVHT